MICEILGGGGEGESNAISRRVYEYDSGEGGLDDCLESIGSPDRGKVPNLGVCPFLALAIYNLGFGINIGGIRREMVLGWIIGKRKEGGFRDDLNRREMGRRIYIEFLSVKF